MAGWHEESYDPATKTLWLSCPVCKNPQEFTVESMTQYAQWLEAQEDDQ